MKETSPDNTRTTQIHQEEPIGQPNGGWKALRTIRPMTRLKTLNPKNKNITVILLKSDDRITEYLLKKT